MFSDGVSRHKGVYLFEIFNMLLNVFLRLLKYFNTFQIKYSQYETIWKKTAKQLWKGPLFNIS